MRRSTLAVLCNIVVNKIIVILNNKSTKVFVYVKDVDLPIKGTLLNWAKGKQNSSFSQSRLYDINPKLKKSQIPWRDTRKPYGVYMQKGFRKKMESKTVYCTLKLFEIKNCKFTLLEMKINMLLHYC